MLMFKKSSVLSVIALSFVGLPLVAQMQTEISVSYLNPEKYIDIMDSDSTKSRSIESFKAGMDEFFKISASQYLKPGHQLKLEITEVDRAGDMRYDVSPDMRDLRVLRDVVRVRIEVNYTLLDENQQVIKQGTENLKEFYNLNSISQRKFNSERLYYEKKLLEDWLKSLY